MNLEALHEARAVLESGLSHYESRNMSSAARSYERVLSIARQNKLPVTEVKALYGLGNVYKFQFRYRESLANYQKALSALRAGKSSFKPLDEPLDSKLEASILLSLGYSCSRLGQQLKAIEYTKEILEVSPSFSDAYYNLGCYYAILEDTEKSLEYLGRGKKLFDVSTIRASRTDPDLVNVRNDPRFKKIMYED
jgi:tetratricopeptide (TPR) repeat protein